MFRIFVLIGLLGFATLGFAAEPEVLAGSWKGNWTSSANGHTGPLNARIDVGGGDKVVVHFRGRFLKVVPFLYRSQLTVVGTDEMGTHLSGSQKLPLFGTFTTSATVKNGQFHASFQSGKDGGEFHMTRIGN